ncbi:MAG: hypothetical protein GTN78_09020, partial [Gemmatimonadales bacterium]|nr:hypothetical protein [Gemmatimonadales bacterium]
MTGPRTMPDDDSDITSIPLSLRRSAGAAWRLFRRSLRWWLLLIALLFVAWLVAERQTAAQLRAEYDKLRAAGQPFTLSELAPTIPPGEKNAAEAYLVAMEFLPEDPVLADFDLLRSDRDRAREALKPQ